MKKRIIILLLILVTGLSGTMAQLPMASTQENPIWYYIQTIGESDRAGLVFTEESNKVYGKSQIISLDESEVAPQLWRFEEQNGKYTIINKSSGRKMNLAYDSGQSIRIATTVVSPVTEWLFTKNGNGYNIQANTNISQGNSSHTYAHQANNYTGRAFVIMFESSSYISTDNSKFLFVEYTKEDIEFSAENNEIWYYITSANADYEDKCITDIVSSGKPFINFSLEDLEKENTSQHWKVVKKSTTSNDEFVHLVNRNTGNIIQAKSVENEYYKYTQSTTNLSEDKGWMLTYLGQNQYEISGEEEDGVNRFLFASNSENRQPDFYDKGNTFGTGFAWTFKKYDYWTSLPSIDPDNNIRVYSENRFIIVEGSENYKVFTIQGIELNPNTQLRVGIYLVNVNGNTVKLFVK